jgi:putative endonuclease
MILSMAEKQTTKQTGDWGEDLAAAWLEKNGYQVLEQKLYTPYGEIDILARQQGRLIFVEVKTRRTKQFGHPEEAVTERKLQHLKDSAAYYLQEHPDLEAD